MEIEEITSKYNEKGNLRNLYNQRRCETCGGIVPDNPIRRHTCCVNKEYVFCSPKCEQNWYRAWLRRQMDSKDKQRKFSLV